MTNDLQEIILTTEQIAVRIKELGNEETKEFVGEQKMPFIMEEKELVH